MADPMMRHNEKKQPEPVRMATFSRMCNHRARSTVLRSARRGKVRLTADGKVDLSDPVNKGYMREAVVSAAIRVEPGIEQIKENLQNNEEEI